jgi:TonB family protein
MTSFDLDITESPEVVAPRFTNVERPKEDEFDFAENDDFEIRTDPARPKASYSDTYVLIKMVEPKYPPRELRGGIEGNVTVELYVNEEGVVDQAWVLSALGPMSFQESALEAVRQFVFKPATENGQPIPMSIRFVIKFRIFG